MKMRRLSLLTTNKISCRAWFRFNALPTPAFFAVQWAYVVAIRAGKGWPGASLVTGACLNGPDGGSGALLWAGFVITGTVTLLGSFLLGAGLVRLPVLRDVL